MALGPHTRNVIQDQIDALTITADQADKIVVKLQADLTAAQAKAAESRAAALDLTNLLKATP